MKNVLGILSRIGAVLFILVAFVVGCGVKEELVITPLPILPYVPGPFTFDVPASQSQWLSNNPTVINGRVVGRTSVQESGTLRLEVRRDYGASIQIYDKVTNQPLINFKDLGRESGMSSYAGPRSFADDSPRWKGIGYNPLQAGDDGGNPSPILFHGYINGWIYTKAQCLSWPHQNARQLPLIYEQWVRVDSNKVHVNVRLTHRRPDKTFYGPEAQEWPMMMINGARNVHFYNGSSPYTNDLATVTDGIEARNSDGTIVPHQGTSFCLTEPWQGVEIGTNQGQPRLIGLYTAGYFRANYNMDAIQARDNSEAGNTITYTANQPMVHLDSDHTWHRSYTYVLGSEQEIRQYVYAQERQTTPDFVFNKANGRNGWTIMDGGYDQKEPFSTDNWQVTVTGKADNGPVTGYHTKLISPFSSWNAREFRTLYIRMAYTGSTGVGREAPLRLAWLLNGQADGVYDSQFPRQNAIRFPRGTRNSIEQSIGFMAINDGQFHTYKINVADNPKWTGIIQQIEIAHALSPAYVAPGEVITLQYVGTQDPGQ
ncbi:hypothetical protein [Spirosoma utsteinense]|uniref:Uncharacterized protein n=1 Tax=Spirosoma utsteinense TaxID=2585773 RepID=A0ABR6W5E6_9BACT|nr:hypothetical protein [Spirosoma utsteinense]MBC3785554.1 hypothetical protein [Spirosoma utsteinense]MBC3791702.1 hypothetical protein [Spirosoma utsteinense]